MQVIAGGQVASAQVIDDITGERKMSGMCALALGFLAVAVVGVFAACPAMAAATVAIAPEAAVGFAASFIGAGGSGASAIVECL